MWAPLPMIPGGLPSVARALGSPSPLARFPFDTRDFAAWVHHGNPWHMQAYGGPPSLLYRSCPPVALALANVVLQVRQTVHNIHLAAW